MCGLMQVSPVPREDELARFYDREYRSEGFNARISLADYPYDSRARISRGRSLRRLAESHAPLGDASGILEIGAGFGHNLCAFREKWPGARIVALENDPCCQDALAKSSAEVVPAYWGDRATEQRVAAVGPFHLVLMIHVLEHPCNPREFLERTRSVLSDDGIAIIEVPCASPSRIEAEDHSPHLSFFDPSSLRSFLQRCGMQILFLETCGPLETRSTDRTPRALLAGLMPEAAKRFYRRIVRRQSRSVALSWPERSDPELVPVPFYAQYGGNRIWLRAVARFASGTPSS